MQAQSTKRRIKRHPRENGVKMPEMPKEEVPATERRKVRIERDRIVDLEEERKELQKKAVKVEPTGYESRIRVVNRASRWNWLRKWASNRLRWYTGQMEDAFPAKWVRKVEMKRKYVEMKVVTRCVNIFCDPKKVRKDPMGNDVQGQMYMQVMPVEFLNRISVCHVKEQYLGWLRKYAYAAELDMIPEPQEINWRMGVDPTKKIQEYRIIEEVANDIDQGKVYVYRLETDG